MRDVLEGIDLAQVVKGTVFSVEQIVRQILISPGDPKYSRALWKFAAELQKALKRLGRPAVVRRKGDCLKVLTDDEASDYNDDYFHSYIRRAEVRNVWMNRVDKDNLTSQRRQEHDRKALIQGVILVAVRAARTEIARSDHVRAHPIGPFGKTQESE